ncbi:MAG: hypothetical protein ACOZEN_13765 [Thermodesulfobacteriota bacterium]|jgi:hypothetical protein
MADGQVATTAASDKTLLDEIEKAKKTIDAVLCELQFIRDGFRANNGLHPNDCNEFSITGGVALLGLTIEKADSLVGNLDIIGMEARTLSPTDR